MAGIGNNATAMGDWMPSSPSHRNFFSNLMAEDFDARSLSNRDEEQENFVNTKEEGEGVGHAGLQLPADLSAMPNTVSAHKPSLTERRAARAGFCAPTIDTDQIRAANFSSSSSDIRSPYLTIPPGLSPTTLLDSPVFLSNSLAQQSPTTGTFSFPPCNNDSFLVPDKIKDHPLEGSSPQSSDMKPPMGSSPFSFSSGENQSTSTIDPQSLLGSGELLQNSKETCVTEGKVSADDVTPIKGLSNSTTGKECSPAPDNSQEEEKGESSLAVGAPAEDGYNWRKYGQKHVKGSEYPRSYYKCTHPNCPVKKKVERNHEGLVTEIIYKGAHNHPKPPPNRRSGVPSSHPFNDYQSDGHDWRHDGGGLDGTPPASGATEYGETQEGGEVSSTLSNEENEEDRATHGSMSVGCDGEGEETESKRRKVDACAVELSAGSRALREPRVVVQTTSEIDILDDGYRWRKYGQKVVKGNPNPRSYYKCTNPGCTVRKHVERASHDLKSVITTYEGKHNHEVPAARGGSGSTGSAVPTSAAPAAPQPARPKESFTRFDGPPAPLAAFGLHGRERVGPPTANFAFGVGPQGFSAANLAMARFGPMALPSVNAFMGHHRQAAAEAGFAVPKGEPREESMSDPSLNLPSPAAAYYHQLMGRMPLGPQL